MLVLASAATGRAIFYRYYAETISLKQKLDIFIYAIILGLAFNKHCRWLQWSMIENRRFKVWVVIVRIYAGQIALKAN